MAVRGSKINDVHKKLVASDDEIRAAEKKMADKLRKKLDEKSYDVEEKLTGIFVNNTPFGEMMAQVNGVLEELGLGKFAMEFDNLFQGALTEMFGHEILRSSKQAQELIQMQLKPGSGVAPEDIRYGTHQSIQMFPAEAIKQMDGMLKEQTVYREAIHKLSMEYIAGAEHILRDAVATGGGPLQAAAKLRKHTNMVGWKAEQITRTTLIAAHRKATQVQLDANKHVVKGWIWYAAVELANSPCPICWAMHGTKHPNSETLITHPSCRCSMVPETYTWAELGFPDVGDETSADGLIEPGEELFAKLPEAKQLEILGPGRMALWRHGEYDLKDFVGMAHVPGLGKTRVLKSLSSMGYGPKADRVMGSVSNIDWDEKLRLAEERYRNGEIGDQRIRRIRKEVAEARKNLPTPVPVRGGNPIQKVSQTPVVAPVRTVVKDDVTDLATIPHDAKGRALLGELDVTENNRKRNEIRTAERRALAKQMAADVSPDDPHIRKYVKEVITDDPNSRYHRGDIEDDLEAAMYVASGELISAWEGVSPYDIPTRAALHGSIERMFGITDAKSYRKEMSQADRDSVDLYQPLLEERRKKWADRGEVVDLFTKHTYARTQQQLKDAGITEMTLFRGEYFIPGEDNPSWADETGVKPITYNTAPLASFTASRVVAKNYASSVVNRELHRQVIIEKVPASRIFSSAKLMGNFPEYEFTVIHGDAPTFAVDLKTLKGPDDGGRSSTHPNEATGYAALKRINKATKRTKGTLENPATAPMKSGSAVLKDVPEKRIVTPAPLPKTKGTPSTVEEVDAKIAELEERFRRKEIAENTLKTQTYKLRKLKKDLTGTAVPPVKPPVQKDLPEPEPVPIKKVPDPVKAVDPPEKDFGAAMRKKYNLDNIDGKVLSHDEVMALGEDVSNEALHRVKLTLGGDFTKKKLDQLEERLAENLKNNDEYGAEIVRSIIADARKDITVTMSLRDKRALINGEIKKVLAEIRPFGMKEGTGPTNIAAFDPLGKAKQQVADAMNVFPTDWVEKGRLSPKGKLVIDVHGDRAKFSSHNGVLTLAEDRYNQSQFNGEIAVHELTHYMETVHPEIGEQERVFYDRRTQGEPLEWMGPGYGQHEKVRKDKFINKYMGKVYPQNVLEPERYYEIMTMGLQEILAPKGYSEQNVIDFEQDPDYRNFVVGVLAGI
jgi:hypothetical protein